MENIFLYGTAESCGSPENTVRTVIEYYLTETDLRREYCDLKKYGIIIKKRTVLKNGGSSLETRHVKDVFYRLSDARRFLDMLIKNKTTPDAFNSAVQKYTENIIHNIDYSA